MTFLRATLGFFLVSFAVCFANPVLAESTSPEKKPAKYHARFFLAHGPYHLVKEATEEFVARVRRDTGGEVEIETIVPEFGGYDERAVLPVDALKAVQANKYEMSQIYTNTIGSTADPRYYVLDLPFLFRDHDHASAVLDGKIGEELLTSKKLLASNLRGLAFTYSGGYRMVVTRNKEIKKAEDFASLRLNTMGGPVAAGTMRIFRSTSLALPKVAIPEAMNKGYIDGFESTYTRFGGLPAEQQLAGVVNETFHSLHLTSILINEKFFQKLPAKHRKVLKEAALDCARHERAISIREGNAFRERGITGTNVKRVELPESERARLKALTAPLASSFPQYFKPELVKRIEAVGR